MALRRSLQIAFRPVATVYGQSEAFLRAARVAHELGLSCEESDVLEIDNRIKDANAALTEARNGALGKIARDVERHAAIDALLGWHQRDYLAIRALFADRVCHRIEGRIAGWREWGRGVRVLIAWPVSLWLQSRVRRVRAEVDRFGIGLDAERKVVAAKLHALRTNPDATILRCTRRERHRLDALNDLRSRPEIAGARGELLLLREIEVLPDVYEILNNVRLRAPSFMRFKDVPLQTAQVDHIVVGPPGVFVIETKNWSRGFASDVTSFNPHDQVGRARHLCNVLLKDHGWHVPVRSVIALAGAAPPPVPGSYAKVLPIGEVRRFVEWFPARLAEGQVRAISAFLQLQNAH